MKLKNFSELKELLNRLWIYAKMNQASFDTYWRERGPVLMAKEIAANLWFHLIPENKDTVILRYQIKFLNVHCHWDYEK